MNTIEFQDLLNILIALGTLLSVILVYVQLNQYSKYSRAAFIKDMFLKFYEDQHIRDIFYKIEYNKFVYTPKFHGSINEQEMDKMLTYLDVLGILAKKKVIKIDDLEPLYYEIKRIYCNKEVRKYLDFLKEWYKHNNIDITPLYGLEHIIKKLKVSCIHDNLSNNNN